MNRLTKPRTLTVLLKLFPELTSGFRLSKSGILHYLFPELPNAFARGLERAFSSRGHIVPVTRKSSAISVPQISPADTWKRMYIFMKPVKNSLSMTFLS